MDGGDELIKPGEPGAWSLWGPNAETGVVDTRIIGGDDVNYKTVPEPSSLVGLGILAMTLLAAQKKNKSQSNIKF
ncbi:MAG: PEP-CTERM sorting domain-containing protein [Limnoraphis robusta]